MYLPFNDLAGKEMGNNFPHRVIFQLSSIFPCLTLTKPNHKPQGKDSRWCSLYEIAPWVTNPDGRRVSRESEGTDMK